jgi:threonine/homoserine/homoserine lactone efflux protein
VITNFIAFLGVAIVVIVTPGQDTALTIRNTLVGHRKAGIATAAGVSTGQLTWTVATSAGLAALLAADQPVFTALKLVGAGYLVFLGIQAILSAIRRDGAASARSSPVLPGGGGSGRGALIPYRQGVFSNLSNPKMIVFFSSLLPQFVTPGPVTFMALVLLGVVFCTMTFVWLSAYAIVVGRLGDILRRERIRRSLEAATGLVLVGLGLRLATHPR